MIRVPLLLRRDLLVVVGHVNVDQLVGPTTPAVREDSRVGAQWCSSMIKMIRGIGIPSNHRRIGIGCSFHSQVVIDVVIDARLFCPKYRPEGLRLRSLPGRPRKHR